jgi:hypothetical protein
MHSDFRADNIFRMPDGDIAVIDWENIVRARGAVDLGWFAMASLSIQSRRTHEAALLNTYVNTVQAAGIDDYGYDQCLRDYRLGIANALIVAVLGVVVLDSLAARDPGWSIEIVKRTEASHRRSRPRLLAAARRVPGWLTSRTTPWAMGTA